MDINPYLESRARDKELEMKTKLLLLLAAVAAVGMYGCNDIAGGGWMKSSMHGVDPDAKATFGFDFECLNTSRFGTDSAEGMITYHDHGLKLGVFDDVTFTGKDAKKKLAFNGMITRPEGVLEADICVNKVWFGSYVGTYTPIPPTLGPGGDMYVYVEDSGDQGPDKDDYLYIELSGGIFDGYYNEGTPGGGNIVLQD
jgi:hypothetical protein